MKPLYLDSHVVIFLYDKLESRISANARSLINACQLCISPIVKLEIQYLFESQKISVEPAEIFSYLEQRIGLSVVHSPYHQVIANAMTISWTRDVFDRLIVAESMSNQIQLLTKDRKIRDNYLDAVWD